MTAATPREMNEATFRAALEQAAVGIAQLSLDGCFLTVNDRFCQIVGYPREELVGRSFTDITAPADLEADLASTARLRSGEISTHMMEKRYIHKDGRTVWANLAGSLVRDTATGEPLSFVAIVEDITARKKAERALRESERRLQLALDATREGIWDWNIVTGDVRFSPRWITSLGYKVGEVPPRIEFWESILHPDDRVRTKQCLQDHMEGKTPTYECENRLLMKSGVYRWNLDRGAVVEWDAMGRPTRMVGADSDISDRKRAEQTVRENEERLRLAAHAGRMFAFEWDPATDVVRRSRDCAEILGLTGDPTIDTGTNYFARVVPEDRERFVGIVKGLTPEKPQYQTVYRVARPDGKIVWFEEGGQATFVDGEITRLIGMTADITGRRSAEIERDELQRQLLHSDRVARTGTLAASLAHELNQPLAAILSNAQAALRILKGSPPDLEEIRLIVEDIVRDDRRAAGVISGLRSMLRRQKTERSTIDLADAVHEVLDLMRTDIVMRGTELEVDLCPGCAVAADKAQIQQVVMNFVMNALDAMEERPRAERRLRVTVLQRDAARVRALVRDAGTGTTPETLDHAFDPFCTTKRDGLGLGLAICREIIHDHGGQIRLEPNEDGVGMTAWFDLDAASPGS
jgi:PAS domain S-box-containing protein